MRVSIAALELRAEAMAREHSAGGGQAESQLSALAAAGPGQREGMDPMKPAIKWSRMLTFAGLAGMLLGALDPLEGSMVILPGAGLVALGGLLGVSRRRHLLYGSFGLVAVGVGLMFALSAAGGVGGNSGRSAWWALVLAPYPVGWAIGVTGAVLALIESFRRRVGEGSR